MLIMDFALKIFAAMVLGAIIGAERQWRQKIAGLRTNALVAIGASLFVLFSSLYPEETSPTRVAAQVVSGIGFLGAGVIIREGFNIRGLNTAATLWCSAAVGVLAGSGYVKEAAVGTLITVLANIVIRYFQQRFNSYGSSAGGDEATYKIRLTCEESDEIHIRSLLLHEINTYGMRMLSLSSEHAINTKNMEVQAVVQCLASSQGQLEKAIGRMSLEKTINSISWKVIGSEGLNIESATL